MDYCKTIVDKQALHFRVYRDSRTENGYIFVFEIHAVTRKTKSIAQIILHGGERLKKCNQCDR